MAISPSPQNSEERTRTQQDIALRQTLRPWLRSPQSWTLQSPVPGVNRIVLDAQILARLRMGVKWCGDTLTAILDVWHAQYLTFNPTTSCSIRVATTYGYARMEQAYGLVSGTPDHEHAVLFAATSFRYKARRDPAATLQSILSHQYLVVPLHLFSNHWALAIVVNAPNLLPENRKSRVSPTYIFTLDSLAGDSAVQASARDVIQSWLMFCVNSFLGGNAEGKDIVGIEITQTAIQPNGVDCGPYVHHHVDTFFQPGVPDKLLSHYTGGRTMMTGGDLRELWRYPTALECRYTVARKILGELELSGQTP